MIYEAVQNLINYALRCDIITSDDELVIRNQLMQALGLTNWSTPLQTNNELSIEEILRSITDYACQSGNVEDTVASRDLFDTKIMGILTPFPHEVIRIFHQKYSESPNTAADWYYKFSKSLNYVRAERIARDIKWTYRSEYGCLDITINLSKPEKDPRDIAAAKNAPSTAYPKCQLCAENAGFAGNLNHPARQNLRPIPIKVFGEKWQLQYSPYGYYNEHCIAFNEQHVPMKIDVNVFEKLFDLLEFLPDYFFGSNADLPIVGGSILSHEHFQGGRYCFAMEKAPVEKEFCLNGFGDVQMGIVRWPMSVIRLKSGNRKQLAAACAYILDKWRGYSDPAVGVYAETNGTPHNTITPIARMNGTCYECDLVLRNNLTTEERPLGVFHPNPSLHHIKKENIGLIEVMGLAVLPSRLAYELDVLREGMLSGMDLYQSSDTVSHADWAKEVLERNPGFSEETSKDILRAEVGAVFEQVLSDAGVFKRNAEGQSAFQRFIEVLESEESK